MKPSTLYKKNIYKNHDSINNSSQKWQYSGDNSLNNSIIIYTDDGYAEIIVPTEITKDLISTITDSHVNNLYELNNIISKTPFSMRSVNSPEYGNKIYAYYTEYTNDGMENVLDAGYLINLPGIDFSIYLKH